MSKRGKPGSDRVFAKKPERKRSAVPWILAIIVLLGLLPRLWNIAWGLPGLHEEAIPLRYAMTLWGLPSASIDYRFFVYPALSYYLVFVAQIPHFLIGYLFGTYSGVQQFLLAYAHDPTIFAVLSRLLSSLFDVGTILLTYVLGVRVANQRVGMVGAFLVAVNFLLVKEAHLINVDTPLAFLSMLSIVSIFQMFATGSRRWYVLSGLACGLAAATKYNAAVLLAVLLTAHLLRAASFRQAIRSLEIANFMTSIGIAVATFVVLNPLIFFHFDEFITKFTALGALVESVNLGMSVHESSFAFYLFDSLPSNLGVPLSMSVLISFVYLLFRKRKDFYLLVSFPIVFLGVLFQWSARAERYLLPIVPLFLLIAAIGLVDPFDYLLALMERRSGSRFSIQTKIIIGMLILVAMNIPPLESILAEEHRYGLPDTRDAALEWIDTNVKPGSAIALGFFGLDLPTDRYITLPIQFNTIGSENLAPFYDSRWYEDLDLVIASDYDYGRYKLDPSRFKELLPFYDSLQTRWTLVKEFRGGDSLQGPTYWFYRYPANGRHSSFDTGMFDRLRSINEKQRVIFFLGKLGVILSARGQLEKSEQVLDHLIFWAPENVEARKSLAEVMLKQGRTKDALSQADTCVALDTTQPDSYLLRGKISYQAGALDGAEADLTHALRLNKQLGECYEMLMLVYGRKHDVGRVIEILSQYDRILPPGSAKEKLVLQEIQKLRRGG